MGPDYLQELAWQKKGNEMNTESLILSAFLSALTGLASIAVWILRDTRKALLDIVEKHFNHVTDEHIHCSQAKLESCKREPAAVARSVLSVFIIFLLTVPLLNSCALLPRPKGTATVSASGLALAKETPVALAEVTATAFNNASLIRWSAALVALAMLGLFCPDWLIKPTEALAALFFPLAFYAVARWVAAASAVMAYVIPICFALLVAVSVYRLYLHARKDSPIPEVEPPANSH